MTACILGNPGSGDVNRARAGDGQQFPDIDVETLVLMLRHHDDNLEATVATLLDLGEDDVGSWCCASRCWLAEFTRQEVCSKRGRN